MTRAMWKRALRAVGVGVEAAASPGCCVPLQARLELVHAIGSLHAAVSTVFDAEDTTQLLGWLEKFVKNPLTEEDSGAMVPGASMALELAQQRCMLFKLV
jgi:hypothetical protein